MALKLPQNPGERISQLLPTVKCSNCNQPVALADLGDHVCPPPPSSTPRPSAILEKIRQASQTVAAPTPLKVNAKITKPNGNVSPASNNDAERNARSMIDRAFRRSKTPQPGVPPPSKSVSPAPSVSRRSRSSSMSRRPHVQIPPSDHISPPLPTSISAGARLEAPMRIGTPHAQSISPVGRSDIPRSFSPGSATHSRRPSVSSLRSTFSTENRPPLPTNPAQNKSPIMSRPPGPISLPSRPSIDIPHSRVSMDRPASARPSLDSRPSHDGMRNPGPFGPYSAGAQRPPPLPNGMPGGNGLHEGEVNMAGVGRRGFQAIAQAALVATSLNRDQAPDRIRTPTVGMDGRRINAPRHLNIDANVTQPSTSSLSPNTPLSSHSPRSPSPHTPNAVPQPGIASSRTPSPVNGTLTGLTRALSPKTPDTVTPRTVRSSSSIRSRLSERFKNKELGVDTTTVIANAPQNGAPASPSDSDYSSSGLAYDRETESALSPTSPPSRASSKKSRREGGRILFPSTSPSSPPQSLKGLPTRSASASSAYSYASRSTTKSTGALERDRYRALDTLSEERPPLPTNVPLSPTSATRSPKLPARSRTTPAMGGSREGREGTDAKRRPRQCTKCNKSIEDGRWIRAEGAGVLCERCWKMMYLPKCRKCNRPIEKQAVSSADGQLKGKYHRDCFNCHKCQQPFPDKEFYVFDGKPYCRYHYHEANDSLCSDPACGQPIEGPCAVAHTGERYHPEHLICEFRYSVSMGSIGSLSGAEGGKRRCTERLEEYWEVDGLMLCERHANMKMEMDIMAPDEDIDDIGKTGLFKDLVSGLRMADRDRDSDPDVRAMRRKTQFIELR